jgi:hypothetical protein
MEKEKVFVKFDNKDCYKIASIRALRALHEATHPDGDLMGLREARDAVEGGIHLTYRQFEVLELLYHSFLPDDKTYGGGPCVCYSKDTPTL